MNWSPAWWLQVPLTASVMWPFQFGEQGRASCPLLESIPKDSFVPEQFGGILRGTRVTHGSPVGTAHLWHRQALWVVLGPALPTFTCS